MEDSYNFININYPDTDIIFATDTPIVEGGKENYLYTTYGGTNLSYPMTVIVGKNGKIVSSKMGSVTYDELKLTLDFMLGN